MCANVPGHISKIAPCPYMIEHFKNLSGIKSPMVLDLGM